MLKKEEVDRHGNDGRGKEEEAEDVDGKRGGTGCIAIKIKTGNRQFR